MLAQGVKGMKRFENFLKREEEKESWRQNASPEDLEYLECQEELSEQLLEQHTQVERVIGESPFHPFNPSPLTPLPSQPLTAARNTEDCSQEYLCKWRGLPYAECTWEDGQLVSDRFQAQVDSFLDRNNSDCIPNRNARVLRQRPKFSPMKEQPQGLGDSCQLRLRDYQLDGINWLVHSWCK